MGRLLVFFQPVEVLNLSPQVFLPFAFKIFFILFSSLIVKGIGCKDHLITVLDDRLARYENFESGIIAVVNTQLMAIYF